jgi:hypothetical protein
MRKMHISTGKMCLLVVMSVLSMTNGPRLVQGQVECPPPVKTEKCVGDTTILTTTNSHQVVNGKCVQNQMTTSTQLTECTKFQSEFVCPEGSCEGHLVISKRIYRNCKTAWVPHEKKPAKCCCPGKSIESQEEFDEDLNANRITTTVTTWVNGECLKTVNVQTKVLDCRGECRFEYEPCNGLTATRTSFCNVRQGRQCVTKKHSTQVYCGKKCDSEPYVVKEDCRGGSENRVVTQYINVYDPKSKTCVPEVLSKGTEKCFCPDAVYNKKCLTDINVERVTTTSYRLQGGICHMNRTVNDKALPCSKKPQLISRKVSNRCIEGYNDVTEVYEVAVGCKCETKTETYRKVCCCPCLDNKILSTKCIGNQLSIIRQTTSLMNQETCAISTTETKQTVVCEEGEKTIPSGCEDEPESGNSVRTLRRVRQEMQNCECKTIELETTKEICKCNPTTNTDSECVNSQRVVTRTFNKLENNTCTSTMEKKEENVVCPAPVNKIIDHCAKTQKRELISTTYKIEACQCVPTTTQTTCSCHCDPPPSEKKCLGNFMLEMKTFTVKETPCGCTFEQSIRKTLAPRCALPKKTIVKRCDTNAMEGYEFFQTLSYTKNPYKCNCIPKTVPGKKLCHCKDVSRYENKCVENGRMLYVTEFKHGWNHLKNKCVWNQAGSETKSVNCPADTRSERCEAATNTLIIETVTYSVENCECVKNVDVKKASCSCDPSEKIIKREECSRDNCRQTIFYTIQARNADMTCSENQLSRQVTCCCPSAEVSSVCEDVTNDMVKTNVSYSLNKGVCLRDVKVERTKTLCSGEIEVRNNCNPKNRLSFKGIYETYKRVTEKCKCKWMLIKTEEGYCKCRGDQITSFCDVQKSTLTITTVSYKLDPPQCIDIKKVTTKTITCPGQQIIQGECDMKKGIRFITTVTYHLDNNCECFKNVKITSMECNCERLNNVTHGCHSDVNEIWKQTVSFTLKNGKCVTNTDIRQQPIVCQSLQWQLTQRGQICMPTTGDALDMGIRKDIYERDVKSNCKCQKESKTVRCNCKCTGPEKISECNSGVLTHIYYKYRWDENQCQCHKTILRKAQEVVTCPKPSRVEGECHPNSCFKEVKSYLWQLDGCTCMRKERPSQEKCCCQPASSSVVCQPFTNLNENVTYQYFLNKGICLERKIITTTALECTDESYPRVQPLEACDPKTGRQKFSYVIQESDGCKCVERTFFPRRPCKCDPPSIIHGDCNMATKRMDVTITQYKWSENSRDNQCTKSVKTLQKLPCVDCSPHEGVINSSCIGGRVLVTSRRCVWNAEKKFCDCFTVYQDRTPMCSHEVRRVEEMCDGTRDHATVKLVRYHLCDCRCKENVTIISQTACRCPPQRVFERCVNNNIRVRTIKAYRLSENACRNDVKVQEKTIECNSNPEGATVVGQCNPKTCQVKITITKESVRNCACVKETFVKHQSCCCEPKTPVIRKSCDFSRGMHVHVNISARYDHESGLCRHAIMNREVPVICNAARTKKVITECQASNKDDNVFYQTVLISGVQRKGCECVPILPYKQQEPCGCRKASVKSSCVNNVKITERISFSFDGTTCVAKFEIVNVNSVKCQQTTFHRTSTCGGDNTRLTASITQEARKCVCESKATHGREPCRCPSTTKETCLGASKKIVKSIPNLVCPKTRACCCQPREVTYTKSVCCDPPKQMPGECIQGRRRHVLKYYIVKNCQCIPQQQVQEVPCGAEKCVNEAGDEACKVLTADRGCVKEYSVRKEKCRKMCDECLDCQGEIYFTKRRSYDMAGAHGPKDRYFLLYLAYPNPVLCKSACANNKRCKTFQLTRSPENRKHACLLSPLTQDELSKRLANVNSIEAKVVDHFHKQCKFNCPPTKYFPSDKCIDTGRPDAAQRYVRKVTVISYKFDENQRRCEKHQVDHLTPCNRTCIDLKPEPICSTVKRLGQCNMGNNDILCGKSCHASCDCSSRSQYTKKNCPPKENKGTLTTYTITYALVEELCTVSDKVKEEAVTCDPEQPKPCGSQFDVQDCIGNIRQVYNITRVGLLKKNICVVDSSKSELISEYSCEQCCPTTEVYPGPCQEIDDGEYQRKVTIKFWGRENDCCKEKILVNTFGCHPQKCSKDSVVNGSCMLGKQPILLVWNVYEYSQTVQDYTCVKKVNIQRVQSCKGGK